MAQTVGIQKVSDIVPILTPYFQSGRLNFLLGAGASASLINVLGNCENEINQLLADGKELEAYKKAYEFIKTIIIANKSIYKKGLKQHELETLEYYKKFILNVDRILFRRKTSILPRQANIFSTNYDMLIEYSSNFFQNIVLNDGFYRVYDRGNRLIYRPETFFDRRYRSDGLFEKSSEIPTINLIKLHGSLCWKVEDNDIYFSNEFLIDNDETQNDANLTEVGEDLSYYQSYFKKLGVILPMMNKFRDTLFQRVYYDSFRIFSKCMDAENPVLISFGFSFNDEHILDIIHRSLRNPTSQLIIFSYSEKSANDYGTKFKGQNNVLIYKMANVSMHIDFPMFNECLGSLFEDKGDE